MPDIAIALVVHVLSVLWWIGSLAFITAVFLPLLRKAQFGDAQAAFHVVEGRFEPQARVAVVLVGLSGIYLLLRLHLWSMFLQARFWWLDAMALYWLLFMLLLFVLGPTGLLRHAMRRGGDETVRWRRMQRVHLVLLVIALVIIAGAVSGSHGFG
ncbi:MAG TPA: hypothetical protein VJS89_09530 [Gammaproteobacteria bacterium]|nr:hypothetical protein [Gammaproteobacteria bacterium]